MLIEKTCDQCAVGFCVRRKYEKQRFCSVPCRVAHQAVHGRPAALATPTSFNCKTCDGPFEYKPSYLTAYRKKHGKDPVYCSRKCFGIGMQLSDDEWQIHCVQCADPMPIQRKPGGQVNRQRTLCSTPCRSAFRRARWQAKHADAVPTRRVARHGYIRMVIPGTNGNAPRDVLEHRYVMEQSLGRPLYPEETVHHKDGDRAHNQEGNLELFSSRHGPGQRVTDKVAFAIDMLRLYPEFARAAGVEMRDVAHT